MCRNKPEIMQLFQVWFDRVQRVCRPYQYFGRPVKTLRVCKKKKKILHRQQTSNTYKGESDVADEQVKTYVYLVSACLSPSFL